jgi:hypothetical protein
MATDLGGTDITCIAGSDLSTGKYLAVALASDGQVDIADSQGEVCIGILQEATADAAGKVCRVRTDGTSIVEAGAAFEEGVELMADADGQLITATSAKYVVAVALEAAADAGDHVRALITRGYLKAS